MATTTFADALSNVKSGTSPTSAATKLLSSLTQDEKLSLLDGDTPFWPGFHSIMTEGYIVNEPYTMGAVPRVGVPGIKFTDGPRGINMGNSTVFPVSMARGATWDVSLEEKVGLAIGKEGRAQGANLFGGVCINLPRHPAWGRAQETYSDDPILLGRFGAAITRGIQHNLMATVKHYALNSMENARFQVDVSIPEAVLHEHFLPHFREVVEEGAFAVMSAYNSVNGEWAGQNEVLLTKILRDQWNFKGLVMSDFIFGLRDPAKSLQAGMEIEAPFSQQRSDPKRGLKPALENGEIGWELVDRAATRILETQLQFFASRDEAEPNKDDVVFCKEHQDLAREVAQRSMVLLKNEPTPTTSNQHILPLDPSTTTNLAIVGRLANKPNTGDQGSSIVRCSHVVTAYEGLKAAFPNSTITLADTSAASAADAASTADTTIVCVGYTAADEGEYLVPVTASNPSLLDLFPGPDGSAAYTAIGTKIHNMDALWSSTDETGGDRTTLRLPSQDVETIRAVAQVSSNVIVCITTAGAVICDEWRHLDNIRGIVVNWYAGTQGGNALADVLTGKVDASGRLPYAVPKDEADLPFFDKDARNIEYDQW